MNNINLETLADQTFFVSMKFERFGNLRKANVIMDTDANESRFKHSKVLLDSPELKAIVIADRVIKERVEALCMPSKVDIGVRFAPVANFSKIATLLKSYQMVERPALVEAFLLVVPEQIEAAKLELKEHFNAGHFPSTDVMREEFSFRYSFPTFGVSGKLESINPTIFAEEKAKMAEFIKDAAEEVILAMRATAQGLVQKLADGLSGEKSADGKTHKLLPRTVEKLQEFVNGFDVMNCANDTELKAEMAKLTLLMNGMDVEKIRHSEGLKTELSLKVGEIAHSLSVLAVVKGRKFREE